MVGISGSLVGIIKSFSFLSHFPLSQQGYPISYCQRAPLFFEKSLTRVCNTSDLKERKGNGCWGKMSAKSFCSLHSENYMFVIQCLLKSESGKQINIARTFDV